MDSRKHLFFSEAALGAEKKRHWQMSLQTVARLDLGSGSSGVMRNVANEEWFRGFEYLS